MQIIITPVTPFQQNSSLLICEQTRQAAVVDPGGDLDRILATAEREQVTIEKILVTHGHLDHAAGVAHLSDQLGVSVEGPHQEDQFWIDQIPEQARAYGFAEARSFVPDRWLSGGDTVSVGQMTLEVLHCPGHTPGHVVFFNRSAKLALVGDVLFKGSIGRSDFPRGDLETLLRSIREQLWPLGDSVCFVPGHGPTSTFGEERRSNPFVGDQRMA
jgi:glyoxylase-like metal-dependent hydrolase (beta-lactamase superfamily II)